MVSLILINKTTTRTRRQKHHRTKQTEKTNRPESCRKVIYHRLTSFRTAQAL